ncbi:ABC-type sulfonate/nitrate/taurine transporter permease protein [Candidatus Symbiobacter mobilis CR]|uniref:ABC-type sulfonate/nitrate/taurine transporter permease protein n=2 Tax=Candidatus Symbiobacter TaxID=1436289 RepID=U5N831_9BURK|nr:ABC-type sulfonate/nitrate/taurine transporter permease protein [Candidatus Symbiobacter mobilis CR]
MQRPVSLPAQNALAAHPRAASTASVLHGHASRAWIRWRLSLISALAVVAFLVLWQLSGSLHWVDPLLLPPPSDILTTALELAESGYRQTPLWQHWAISTARALLAVVVAIGVGVPLGLGMGLSPILAATLNPFVQFLRPLPKIALIPLVIVWFGIGESAKFFLIFVSSFLSIVVGSAAAVLGVSQARLRAAQTLGASRRQLFWYVVLPDALPELFTSVRLSVGIGWTTLIAAEMIAAHAGLGWMVINAGNYLRTDVVLLGIALLGLTGYFFDWILLRWQKRLAPWSGKDA